MKKYFEADHYASQVAQLIENKQNRILEMILFVGAFLWLIWIFFDYWFAPEKWLQILPFRLMGSLAFFLAYFFKRKLNFKQKQNIAFSTVNISLAYMFAIIDKSNFPTYFTGFTFTTAIIYQTFHISRKLNFIYSFSILGVFLIAYIFNEYTFVEILGGGGFATLSILFLMAFIAENNRQADIDFFQNTLLIQQQKQDIESKNKSITESITYAKRIQMSILPNEEAVRKSFSDVFIIYKPKDIVSGDFYWFAESKDKIVIAVADCTGHGVPGAFMTLINNNFLNQIIKEQQIFEPHRALQCVREKVILSLNTYQERDYIKDGMDISLLSIDKTTFEVQFAGANRPLWVLRDETLSQIEEIKGDKLFIGYDDDWQSKNFQKQEFFLNKGDRIYLFTDGITDQFGGEKNRKFGQSRLKQVLLETAYQPLKIQKIILEDALQRWQGANQQTDDMCMVGIEI
ncbi:MAG: SpoIIE family protein phosphatase [Raineya sp.]|nr:SpoIIE family protein phosphatase [Raineya sp.]MDW8296100.1 SpoIIE family protein phosphatase [Raineya sp.]